MAGIYLKRTSTGLSLRFRLDNNGAPYDLTSCTVKINLRDTKDRSVKLTLATCTVEDQTANKGWVHYDWQTADVNAASVYDMDCQVTLPNGKPVYWPFGEDNAFITVTVQPIIA